MRAGEGWSTFEALGRSLPVTSVRANGDSLWVRVGAGKGALALDARVAPQGAGPRLVGRLRQGRDTLPFSLARIPDYPTPGDRTEAWAQDLDALATRFLPLDRSFDAGERARFLGHVANARAALPTLGDDQVVARMAAALALARNAHTPLYLLRNASELRRLPVRVQVPGRRGAPARRPL